MKNSLLITMMITAAITGAAQSPTTVTTATNCIVFRDFNLSDEGFSSPSIYSDANDVSFFWNAATGEEIENSGLAIRSGSLISPVYLQTAPGNITVGFKYVAPVNAEYRIRVVSGIPGSPLQILATTANGPVFTPFPATTGNICLLLTDADLIAGTPIRLEFTYRGTQPTFFVYDNLALTVVGGPLPVTFTGFVAREDDNGTVKLLWNVGTEINVKGYYAESSTNGVDFKNIGYVTASGKSIYSLDYPGKLLQTTFFRIKNVDFDGSNKYTPVIKVLAKDQTVANIQIYPVPATDQVTIQHKMSTAKTMITLISPDGKILQQVITVPNSLQTQLHINDLQKGIYMVRYDAGEGDVQFRKIIKN